MEGEGGIAVTFYHCFLVIIYIIILGNFTWTLWLLSDYVLTYQTYQWLMSNTFWIFLSDKFLAFKTPLGPRYDDEIPEANRFQLPMLFAYLQSLKVWVCLVLSERHGSDSLGLNFRLIPTGLLFLVLDCGFFSIINCKDYCYNNSCFMGY